MGEEEGGKEDVEQSMGRGEVAGGGEGVGGKGERVWRSPREEGEWQVVETV